MEEFKMNRQELAGLKNKVLVASKGIAKFVVKEMGLEDKKENVIEVIFTKEKASKPEHVVENIIKAGSKTLLPIKNYFFGEEN